MFFLSSCAGINNLFKTIDKIPAIKAADKIKSFSLITFYLDSHNFEIENFNYAKGTITTNFISLNTGILGSTHLRAKAVFFCNDKNEIDMDFTDIQMENERPLGNGSLLYWQEANIFYSDYIPLHNSIINALDSMNADSLQLRECTNHFLGSFQYNYLVLKSLTEVGRSKFIQQYFLNRQYSWTLPLVEFKYNTNANYKEKFVAMFRYDIKNSNEFNKLFTNRIYLNVYTNNDQLANNYKRDLIDYSGFLVNADETFLSENYNFNFIANLN